ncbi:hypothetical protein BG452_32010 [Streptomyces sp. CBMA123]|nr:hypothetical protein [Streptomyces sp. CBMA123]
MLRGHRAFSRVRYGPGVPAVAAVVLRSVRHVLLGPQEFADDLSQRHERLLRGESAEGPGHVRPVLRPCGTAPDVER